MPPSSLTIQLFGPLRVLIGGEPMPRLRTRPVEWLLALLVLRSGRAVDRSWLAGTLWPESDESQALHNLRDALVHLRKALGPERARLQSPTRDTLRLDLTGAEVDVVQFDAALKAGDEDSLRGAVDLSARPLLEGCTEAWVFPEREYREQACLTALETLAGSAEQRGDTAGALALLRRAESLDNLRDSIQRQLMRVLAASGDTPAALLAYRDYRLRLHRELNVEPDADTIRLFQQIRARGRDGETGRRGDGGTGRPGEQEHERSRAGSPPRPLTPSPPHPLTPSPAPLPHPITALIGREEAVRDVVARIARSRLVTLAGAGGVGKTRLAIEAAREAGGGFPAGAVFVALASLSDPALLPSFVAAALGLRDQGAAGSEPVPEALMVWLAARPVLLVLDNCEHLIDAAAVLCQTLLERCPRLHILATSRQRLGITGEVVQRVPSLPVPPDEGVGCRVWAGTRAAGDGSDTVDPDPPYTLHPTPYTLMQYASVQLFVERAQMVKPGFRLTGEEDAEAVAQICRRLDGIPLAIELAAARAGFLSLREIASRLGERFRLLTGGSRSALTRHQTLHALIDWSYDLLTEPERVLLRRLSVCAGGWTLEAAEAICTDFGFGILDFGLATKSKTPDDRTSLPPIQNPKSQIQNAEVLELLASLTDKSLVLAEEAPLSSQGRGGGEGLRYRMLETVREYAREKLRASGEEASTRTAHAAYLLALAERAEAAMRGPEQLSWLNTLEIEHDNLRAALAWCLEAVGSGQWVVGSPAKSSTSPSLPELLTAHCPLPTAAEAGLRLATAIRSLWITRYHVEEGRRYLEALLSAPQAAGRTPARAAALYAAAALARLHSDYGAARLHAEECLAIYEELGDRLGMARALSLLSSPSREEAQRLAERSLALFRECDDPAGTATALTRLSSLASAARDHDTARGFHREALAIARSMGDRILEAGCLSGLAFIERERHDYAAARDCFEGSLRLARELGMHNQTAVSLYYLGMLAYDEGDLPAARAYWEECREVDRRNRNKGGAVVGALAELAAVQGDYEAARACLEEMLAEGRALGRPGLVVRARRGLGDVARGQGELAGAARRYVESLQAAQDAIGPSGVQAADERYEVECAACLRGIAAILHRSGREERAVRLLGAAAAVAESVGAIVPPAHRTAYEAQVAGLRESLGAAAFAAAWAEGRADGEAAARSGAGLLELAGPVLDLVAAPAAEGEGAGAGDASGRQLPAVPVVDEAAAPSPAPTAPSRLPRPLTALVGREEEVEAVMALLESARLMTLTGGGGVGKTRLALQVAAGLEARYPGRVLFVELAALADPPLLLASVAAALGLHPAAEAPAPDLTQALAGWLSQAPTLLVLDNCEHLIEAAAVLCQTLLERCPRLQILATSRQRLGLTGEVVRRVPSLPAPDPEHLPPDAAGAVAHVLRFPAVQLLIERAVAVRPGFQLRERDEALAVARLCQRLDGIPLALELAAARTTVLSVEQLAARLHDRFQLLTGGSRAALPRHQTLRALIDWSYDTLPAEEAALLRRLSVFAGGWTLEAAEAVCGGEGSRVWGVGCRADADSPFLHPTPHTLLPSPVLDRLDALEECSLVLAEARAAGLRYRMLETVREYSLQKLQACGEEAGARSAHATYFLALAETAAAGVHGPEPLPWLDLLEAEHDNLRAALDGCQKAVGSGQWVVVSPVTSKTGSPLPVSLSELPTNHQPPTTAAEAGLRLAAALWPFWEARGYLSEGRQYLRAALQPAGLPEAPARAQALLGAARLALHQSDLPEAETLAQEAQQWFRAQGDARGRAMALLCRGEVAFARGQFGAAESLLAEGLEACRQSGWSQGTARTLVKLGAVAVMLADTARARAPLEEGLALAKTLGDAPTLARALYERGCLAMREADDARAGALLEQSVEIWRRLGHRQAIAEALGALGRLAGRQKDRTKAGSFLEQSAATYRELGARNDLAWTLQELGNVHYAGDAYVPARAAYEESLEIFRELNAPHGIACADNNLGMTCFHLGDPAGAEALHREALAIYVSEDHGEGMTWSLERLGLAAARRGDVLRAARLLAAAAAARERLALPKAEVERAEWDQSITALRAGLPAAAFEAAWAEGQAMALAEAVRVALEETDDGEEH